MMYKVVLIHSDEGYAVFCPALPGCASQGDTEEEALENIRSAIKDYVEVVEEMHEGAFVREVQVA